MMVREGIYNEKTGRKDDSGKLRWDLVQPRILQEYVKVLTFGANKYAPHNWRKVPEPRPRYFAALLRHLWAWMFLGERNDPETGLHHLAHAMCCLTFMAEPELENQNTVDCTDHSKQWVGPAEDGFWVCLECRRVINLGHESDTGTIREPDSPGPAGGGSSGPSESGGA